MSASFNREAWYYELVLRGIVPVFLEFNGPPMEGNFVRKFQSSSWSCTSVLVLYTTSVISFCLVRLQNILNHWKSVQDEILLDQFCIIEYSKEFKNVVWPKKCAKLSKQVKLTVKRGRALGSFLK